METNKNIPKTDKEKLEEAIQLLSPRKRRKYNRESNDNMQEVTFEVTNNGELQYIISCLLRVCILSLENEDGFWSPRLYNCSEDQTVATVLELVDALMPNSQLYSYDDLEELLLEE
ncbi:hypothetical protein Aeqsu_1008 [Aequorivita sublithincola DSM 14238]|uniref:Uncharacterized protein n=1 Tax=Aequorivita sublithincola (strain DSM 14238 / LMG 21431 / ACAM 643 / 9-3) TaxID=746697 RepID=I3YU41_AEQSU|nr:hypothetical protein [Aequorivita sublithincola]AFL80509.1 hypothetical protein Aeqsu_1008 [Aequorivita sublithincola DSM 14238]